MTEMKTGNGSEKSGKYDLKYKTASVWGAAKQSSLQPGKKMIGKGILQEII